MRLTNRQRDAIARLKVYHQCQMIDAEDMLQYVADLPNEFLKAQLRDSLEGIIVAARGSISNLNVLLTLAQSYE